MEADDAQILDYLDDLSGLIELRMGGELTRIENADSPAQALLDRITDSIITSTMLYIEVRMLFDTVNEEGDDEAAPS